MEKQQEEKPGESVPYHLNFLLFYYLTTNFPSTILCYFNRLLVELVIALLYNRFARVKNEIVDFTASYFLFVFFIHDRVIMSKKGRKNKAANQNGEFASTDSLNNEFLKLLHVCRVIVERLSRFEQYIFENKDCQQAFQLEIRLKSVEEDFQTKYRNVWNFYDHETDNRLATESCFYSLISEAKQLIASINEKQNNSKIQVTLQVKQSGKLRNVLGKFPDLGLPSF